MQRKNTSKKVIFYFIFTFSLNSIYLDSKNFSNKKINYEKIINHYCLEIFLKMNFLDILILNKKYRNIKKKKFVLIKKNK